MSVIGGASAIESGGYQIANSLRLRSSASAYLSRTLTTPTSTTKNTFSAWVKRGALGVNNPLFGARQAASPYELSGFQANDTFIWYSSNGLSLVTTQVFRDPSAWMHILMVTDTTQATAANRCILYINGQQVTSFSTPTYPAQNASTVRNTAIAHWFAEHNGSGISATPDGYLSDVYFIDGQALTPASFGQVDTNGVWVPKAYTGTYGTNGFYLKFNDGSNTTNLCLDRSGNGNNWTPNAVSVAAGATYDWMTDTPTKNFCVMQPLTPHTAKAGIADAGLTVNSNGGTGGNYSASGSMVVTGKVYYEATVTNSTLVTSNQAGAVGFTHAAQLAGNTTFGVGVGSSFAVLLGGGTTAWAKYIDTVGQGNLGFSGAANGDVIQIAWDPTAGYVWFGKNGTWNGTGNPSAGTSPDLTGLTGRTDYVPAISIYNSGVVIYLQPNFGQRPFTYTPPTGFSALNSANLSSATITNPKGHFDVQTFTGNGSTQSISGMQFTPDFIWGKSRSAASDHRLIDRLRGVTEVLYSSQTSAGTTEATALTSFNSDGYTMGGGSLNPNTVTMVDWIWKANGAGVSNTAGSITSTVSANTTAGFSIVTYTGTGANATVGHGLGVAPKMVIVKQRNPGAGTSWGVYHASLGATKYILLNTTAAEVTNTMWNNTAPTSGVFSLGGPGFGVNDSTINAVAYCFAEVPGFSKFGSYTGNGSADGPFVYCGFRPRYVMIKSSSIGGSVGYEWYIYDTACNTYNLTTSFLDANYSGIENYLSDGFISATRQIDILSNGFKVRYSGVSHNSSGATYIFVAFAESPFGGGNVAPATAR